MEKYAFLRNETARILYENAKALPIVDYHCHLSPKDIFEDKPFENIGEIWLSADHYKWRLMRTAGIDEEYITGSKKSYKEKFIKYAEAIEFSAGHPLYHWSHMELMLYFGIEKPLNSQNAESIWNEANAHIKKTNMSPRKLIGQSNVEVVCTTDDIADDILWHERIATDKSFKTKVLPSFRTDNLLLIRREGYKEYIDNLSNVSGIEITDFSTLKSAVKKRLEYFCEHG